MGTARRLALIGCCGVLAACSNKQGDQNVFTVGKAVVGTLRDAPPAAPPDPAVVARVAGHALANTKGPVAVYHLEKRKSSAILRPVAVNGDHVTWASYTSTDRLSVVSRNNVLTSTRGLVNDLMSSELDALLRLVSSRRDGQAEIRQNYLDGEDLTYSIVSVCSVTRGATDRKAMGDGRHIPVTRMTARCQAGGEAVLNTYLVTRGGAILESRHWAGPTMGHGVISRIR